VRIGLVYDLRSQYLAEGYSEHDVAEFDSDATIDALAAAIAAAGHSVERIGHGRDLAAKLVGGKRWDLVFTIAEGLRGRNREAQVPCLLELFGIPCTFSDALVCAVTLDKAIAKRLVLAAGLRTPAYRVLYAPSDAEKVTLDYPLFVKPLAEGTGKGVDHRSHVRSAEQLRRVAEDLIERLGQPALVEEYLPGREFTTGILGTGSQARVLGTIEIRVLPGAPAKDYSYEVKEQCEHCVEYRPLERGPLREEVERLALSSYLALECRDAARVDIRMDAQDRPSFMELNPLPGLHPTHSDLPMIATAEGMAYTDLIGAIIESARERVPGSQRGSR
jgi:D-alanine-D-alanine ligase